jgi:hypothetical protein
MTRSRANFTQEEQVKLTLMINIINGWNRLSIRSRLTSYGANRRFCLETAKKRCAKA